MTARRVTLSHTFEDDAGVEHDAELEADVTPAEPPTRYDGGWPGDIEPVTLRVDGAEISDWSGWQWLVDELVAKPLPKLDEEHAA